MSLHALVAQVSAVLDRGHGLFGDPSHSGGLAAAGAGSVLAGAGDLVRGGQGRVGALSGRFATGYGVFAAGSGAALDGASGADARLGSALGAAAASDRSGRSASGSVLAGAAGDTEALGPFSGVPAGQQALITALRARLAQQQRVIAAYRLRDARMAALLRSLGYARRGRPSMPSAAGGLGSFGSLGSLVGLGGLAGTPGAGGLFVPGLAGLAGRAGRAHSPAIVLAAHRSRAHDAASGPGAVAAEAALSRRGSPYVWGAKGPSAFDCSGLVQWAWRQAGVQLGGDTYAQIDEGAPVPPGQVRAGDMVFPGTSFGESGRPGPGHVMLAISPTQVVHAPQRGDVVRVAPMPSAYVARRPLG